MKKSRFAAVFIVLWLTSGSSVLGAVRQFSTEVDNEVMTGDISISIQEYQWNEEGERVPYIDGKRVVPNEKAVKIVTIVNEAEPAWIRAKAEFSGFAGTAGGEAVLEGSNAAHIIIGLVQRKRERSFSFLIMSGFLVTGVKKRARRNLP